MKHVIVLIFGLITGVVIFVAGMIYSPFISQQRLSPITVTDAQTITLAFSGVASESILFTNNGESRIAPHPEGVLELWEGTIDKTSAMVTIMRDALNRPAGIGIKISSLSEKTRLLNGEMLVDSVWYIYLPDRGAFFIEEVENYWSYFRGVVYPAYSSSANSWKGNWFSDVTFGPGALGTARVTGGTGEFDGMTMLGVESLSVGAWSADYGPVSATGRLTIELPLATNPFEE